MYQGPVIDCDVHHARATDEELLEYLSAGWREYVSDRGPAGIMPLTVQDGLPNPHGFMRADTYPPTGGPSGSDFATMRRQLLDRADVRRAMLTFGDDSHVAGHHNPYFATELARALNDWSVDRWLSADPAARLVDPRRLAVARPGRGRNPATCGQPAHGAGHAGRQSVQLSVRPSGVPSDLPGRARKPGVRSPSMAAPAAGPIRRAPAAATSTSISRRTRCGRRW